MESKEADDYVQGKLLYHWTFWAGKLAFAVCAILMLVIYLTVIKPNAAIQNKMLENFFIALAVCGGLVAGYFINDLLIKKGKQLLRKEFEQYESPGKDERP